VVTGTVTTVISALNALSAKQIFMIEPPMIIRPIGTNAFLINRANDSLFHRMAAVRSLA
jgi:hypothetical protein